MIFSTNDPLHKLHLYRKAEILESGKAELNSASAIY